jgi:hypothetical protein
MPISHESLWSPKKASGFDFLASGVAIEGGSGNAQRLADRRNALAGVVPQCLSHAPFIFTEQPRPSALPPACSGGLEACACALPDQGTLKLRQGREDMEDQLSSALTGVIPSRPRAPFESTLQHSKK